MSSRGGPSPERELSEAKAELRARQTRVISEASKCDSPVPTERLSSRVGASAGTSREMRAGPLLRYLRNEERAGGTARKDGRLLRWYAMRRVSVGVETTR